MKISKLIDLNKLKTAPILDSFQSEKLFKELDAKVKDADWLTIGIMAKSDIDAKTTLRHINFKYSNLKFMNYQKLKASGNVFLKGNQKTGEVYLRSDFGFGEGILVTCHYENDSILSNTYGPFPLSFFCR
tara:strand:+ start:1269 stop:1658 length:390 start_codon:yes stop_codon:yes gene_type:complete